MEREENVQIDVWYHPHMLVDFLESESIKNHKRETHKFVSHIMSSCSKKNDKT